MDKKVDVSFDTIFEFPSNPVKFLQFWIEKIEVVPEEYRRDAKVEAELEDGYLNFSLSYFRPETADEKRIRLERAEVDKKRITDRDLAAYNRLKEKLGL
jgi:hypothetical protein